MTSYRYDEADNLLHVSGVEEVTYTYDAVGNVLTAENESGMVTTYTYNALGLPLTKTVSGEDSIESYWETYGYDLGGCLVSLTNSMGQVIKIEYDAWGNVAKRSVADTNGRTTVPRSIRMTRTATF